MKIWNQFLIFLLLTPSLYAAQVEAENIPSDKYFETALTEINNAKSSIVVYMYLFSIDKNQTETQPRQLLNALLRAKERGVKVEVVLDQNVDFLEGVPRAEDNVKSKNVEAYEILKAHGIAVYFDEPAKYTHSKVVVLDDETVILGSTNWTNTGLAKNTESNLLVRSKAIARDVLEDLKKVKRQAPGFETSRSVALSWEFTNRRNLLGEMVTRGDDRAFDSYLYLLKEYDGNPEAKVALKYEDLAKSLGIEGMPSEAYRRQIIKVLEKLEEKYRLIEFRPQYGKDAEVILKDYDDPAKLYAHPKSGFMKIPVNYWDYGWSRTLPFAGKVMTLLNLSYSAISESPPSWHSSVKTLSERHHISEWFISDGTTTLRRANLVEVEYAPAWQEGNERRRPSVYTPNPLYDPKDQAEKMKTLEAKHGKEKLDKAKGYAALVYEDSDTNGIKTLIELEDRYGAQAVSEAIDIIKKKNPDNPRRTMAYLISTIRGIGEK